MKGSTAIAGSGFGDPTAATSYTLCIYDNDALAAEATVPSGATWKDLSGKGFVHVDKDCTADGICKVLLKAGPAETPKPPLVKFGGKGAGLPDPSLPFSDPIDVTVQAVGSNGACFSDTYSAAKVVDKGDQLKLFKAKN